MSFINEFISPEDVEAYGIKEIDKQFIVGGTNARDWTIDRDRDIYLRNVANGREEFRSETIWTFWWHNQLLTLQLNLIEASGGRGEPGWSHWKLMWVNDGSGLPGTLKDRQSEFLDDLKAALTAYSGAGICSAGYSSYSVALDIGERCVL